MTKLWIISDLHLEFEDLLWPLVVPDADVAVVAGDVTHGCQKAATWVGYNIAEFIPAVFVAGNHEHFGGWVSDGIRATREVATTWPDMHFLECDLAVIEGVRFIGATLWTDFAFGAETAADIAWNERAAEGLLPDYKAILGMSAGDERLLSAPQIGDTHAYASTFIEQALRIPHDGPTVVVTHYAPHPQSVSKQFRGSGLNPAFVSDLSPIIERYAPDLWVHGHMHESFDYRVGRTRVVCNPRGCGTENPGWNPVLVVEV